MKLASLMLFGAASADNRALNQCTEYVISGGGQNGMFMNIGTVHSGASCNMRLGAGFSNTENIDTLVDEGYVTVTWDAGLVGPDAVVTPDSNIYETSAFGDNTIRFDFPDSMSGNAMVIFTFTVDNPDLCNSAPTSFQYCTGTSPTESTPEATKNSVSDASMCQEITLTTANDQHLFNLEASAGAAGNGLDLSGMTVSDYVELEFSGYVQWMRDSLPAGFEGVVNVVDNIWRIHMNDFSLDWIAHLDHIGSPWMEPDVLWAQVCPSNADKDDLSDFASSDECTVLEKYRWDRVYDSLPPVINAGSETFDFTVLYDAGVYEPNSLRDESYIIITHGADVEGTVSGTGVDSAVVDGRTVRLELDDHGSGEISGIYGMTYQYPDGMSYSNDITRVELCRGASPTSAPSTDPQNSEHCQDISNNVGSDNAWACRSCYRFSGDNSAFNPALPWLGYIDVEFAGEVSFRDAVSDPFESIENVMGNKWRLTFNRIMETISFDLDMGFTGSLGMMPRVNWAQGCVNPAAPTTTTTTTTTTPPTEPPTEPPAPTDGGTGSQETRLCVDITVELDKTTVGTVDQYTLISVISGDTNDDNSVQDEDTYMELTFSENLGFVTLPGFSFPVEVLVDLETYENSGVSGGSIEGNVVTLDLGGDLIGEETIDINFGINYNLGGQTGTATGTLQLAQLCNRMVISEETTEEYSTTAPPTETVAATTQPNESNTNSANYCPCTEDTITAINFGKVPHLSKYGQIKSYMTGANMFSYAISQTIHAGSGDTATPGMESAYDGYLVLRKQGLCDSNVLEKFTHDDVKWWIADRSCPNCYTTHDSWYFKENVANRKKTLTLGYTFNGDLGVDTNKNNMVDKYYLFIRGLQAQGVTERQAFDCFAGAKPANVFHSSPGINGGCDYSQCVGEKILIW